MRIGFFGYTATFGLAAALAAPVHVGILNGVGSSSEYWHTAIHTAAASVQSILANPAAANIGPNLTIPPDGFTYQAFGVPAGTSNAAPTATQLNAFASALDTLDVVILIDFVALGEALSASIRAKFLDFISKKGLITVSATIDGKGYWPAFDSLLGAVYLNHPSSDRQAMLKLDTLPQDTNDSSFAFLNSGLADTALTDEWISYTPLFGSLRATPYLHVTFTVDENSYAGGLGGATAMGDHPISWYRDFPTGGRFFYTAWGHESQNFDGAAGHPRFLRRQLYNAIVWAAKQNSPKIPAVPTLLTPAQYATGVPISTSLIWSAASGATSYHLQVSVDSTFATILVNDSAIIGTSRPLGPLANNTAYYWRVNARNTAGTSSYSNVWKFTTEARKPQLVAPTNGKIVPDTTTLIWLSYAVSTSYRLQVSIDSSFSLIIMDDSNLIDTTMRIGPLPRNITYYWRVNAGYAGGTSPWSEAWKFKIQPLIPQLVSPAQNAQNVPTSTTLTWLKFADSTTYHVQLAIDSLFVYTVINDSTLTTTSKATGLLPGSVTYYWHVSARNTLDTTTWSETWNFTTSVTGILQKEFSLQSLNLANGGGLLRFSLPQRAHVRIQIFNAKGQRVLQLLDETRDAGYYNLPLSREAKGSYFLDFRAGDFHKTIPIQP